MARRGRKRKKRVSLPGGKVKLPGATGIVQATDADKDTNPRPKDLAMKQPHRKPFANAASDWLASPVGRLLEADSYHTSGMSKKALYDAATRFAQAYSRWQSVVGSYRGHSRPGASGDMPEATAKKYRQDWADVWRELRGYGPRIERAVFAVVIDPQPETWAPPFWIAEGCITGLAGIAAYYGMRVQGEDKRKEAA